MAAAGWDRSPGAGPRRTVDRDSVYTSSFEALEDLATSIPGFASRLQSKDELDAQQRTLALNGGSIEQTGTLGEQVQLQVSERVGKGTFCVVFRGELLLDKPGDSSSIPVAAKFELRKTDSTQLRNEFRMYKKLDNCPGIAKIYTFGEMDFHKVLVMDLLGPSLESLFQDCGRRFSIKTVAMLAKQMISRIQTIHEQGLIYRDIKPENFLMGLPESDTRGMVHLIDYGMAKIYRDPDTNQHIPYGDAQSLSGTARYMSINAHCRRSQSRRDDLEALGHVFMYFVRGNLPWQGVKAPQNDARYDMMCEKKQATSIDDLCRGFPPEFAQYLSYTRSLTFDGDPDYDYMRGLFTQILNDEGAADDAMYDWIKPIVRADKVGDSEAAGIEPPPPALHKPSSTADGTASLPKVEGYRPKETGEIDETQRPTTPPQVSGHRGTIVVPPPASPPGGKRRRSEFTSDLRPPTRVRPKKTAHSFYDSEAQRVLVTLYRDVMAKRYAFHRAVKQGRGGISAAATAAAAAAAALAARSSTTPGIYSRPVASMRLMGTSVISPAFTETLDKTLAKIIGELEDLSDKLLQDGDYTGAARVHGWLDEVGAAVKEETERLHQAQGVDQQNRQRQAGAAGQSEQRQQQQQQTEGGLGDKSAETPAALPSSAGLERGQIAGGLRSGRVAIDVDPVIAPEPDLGANIGGPEAQRHILSQPRFDPADPLEVDDEEENVDFDNINLRTQHLVRPGLGARGVAGMRSHKIVAAPALSRASPSAAVRSGMDHLSLEVDTDPLEVDDTIAADNTGDDGAIDADDGTGSNDVFALVYRTASGTRKVVRLAERDAQ